MSRHPLARADVDTQLLYHRKVRTLKRIAGGDWPLYFTAWLSVLLDSWRSRERVTLDEAWDPTLPMDPAASRTILKRAGLLDGRGRIPDAAWKEWAEPVLTRYEVLTEAGRRGGAKSKPPRAKPPRSPASELREATPKPPRSHPEALPSQDLPSRGTTPPYSPPPPSENGGLVVMGDAQYDWTDPVDVWDALFGRAPTERQRETFLAKWVNLEGVAGTVQLLHDASKARSSGDRSARYPVEWINRVVEQRVAERIARADADLTSRRKATAEASDEAEAEYRAAVRLWAERGRDEADLTFRAEDRGSVQAYLKQHGGTHARH